MLSIHGSTLLPLETRVDEEIYARIKSLLNDNASWISIANELVQYETKTGEAWRAWYRRRTPAPVVEGEQGEIEKRLAREFGVSERMSARKVKTSQEVPDGEGGKTWESVEWKPGSGESLEIEDILAEAERLGQTPEDIKSVKIAAGPGGQVWRSLQFRNDDEPLTPEGILEELTARVEARAPIYLDPIKIPLEQEVLLIPCLYDAHLEKIGPDKDVPNDYIRTALRIRDRALSMGFGIERTLFVVGHDFGNTDNLHNTTTAFTPQENDREWWDAIDLRCAVAVDAIDVFARVAPVDVLIVGGNHDMFSSRWLGQYLKAWYRNAEQVNVQINPDNPYRDYYQYGRNMWMFSHGKEEQKKSIPGIMAVEQPLMFASSDSREAFLGHIHQLQTAFYALSEQQGVSARWFPALTTKEGWAKMKGYVGRRAGYGLLYDREDGVKTEYPVFLKD